jgi:hypothetical protein
MTEEEIFKEVMKSPELTDIFNIPQEVLNNQSYNEPSNYNVIEVIQAIICDKGKDTDIFEHIQKIMKLV